MGARIVQKVKLLLLAQEEVLRIEEGGASVPAAIVPFMNDASDYVIVHEEGSLQQLPWLSQPSCLVFGDAGKKGGRWLDVPRRNAGVRTLLHLSDNVAVSTSDGQETAERQSPRQPVRQISAQQADDTQLE